MSEMLDARGRTEAEAIEAYRKRNYPKPALTADVAVFAGDAQGLWLLLIRRGGHPCLGKLALPGGFAEAGETIEQTAQRELEEETGVTDVAASLLGVYSKPGRDPRGWTVSVTYLAYVEREKVRVRAGDDASEARWYLVERSGEDITFVCGDERATQHDLAFDHADMVRDALDRLERQNAV